MRNAVLLLAVITLIFGCINSTTVADDVSNMTANGSNRTNESAVSNITGASRETGRTAIEYDKKITETDSGYVYSDYGFSVAFPKNWDAAETNDSISKLILISPPETENDSFIEEISVGKKSIDPEMSSQEYALDDIARIRNLFNMSAETTEETIINGMRAYKVVFKPRTTSGTQIKQMRVYIIKDRWAYFITFTAEENAYGRYVAIAEDVVKSFKIA